MVNILKKLYIYSTLLLLTLLVFASFVSQELLSSIAYRIIYLIYAFIIIASVIFIPGPIKKILHLLLALLIGMSIYVKAVNDRFPITLGQGGSYRVETALDTLAIELKDFTIRHEKGSATAVHYESKIIVNGVPTSVTVNHPFKGRHIRLYQSSYKMINAFNFYSTDTLSLFEGQHAEFNGADFDFLDYDPILNRVAVRYNDILFYLSVGRQTIFLNQDILIMPGKESMASVLEYVEVRGHTLFMIIAWSLLSVLVIDRVRRRS